MINWFADRERICLYNLWICKLYEFAKNKVLLNHRFMREFFFISTNLNQQTSMRWNVENLRTLVELISIIFSDLWFLFSGPKISMPAGRLIHKLIYIKNNMVKHLLLTLSVKIYNFWNLSLFFLQTFDLRLSVINPFLFFRCFFSSNCLFVDHLPHKLFAHSWSVQWTQK